MISFIRPSALLIPALALSALLAGSSEAITLAVGNLPAGGPSTSYELGAEGYPDWFISDLTDPDNPAPILVTTGGGSGIWTQTLTFGSSVTELLTGDQFLVDQLLKYQGGDPLVAWRQEIQTSGWKWADATIYLYETADTLPGLSVDQGETTVGFAFPALTSGEVIRILKVLEYTGPDAAPSSVVLTAAAIPEPGSLVLTFASAAFALGFRRRQTQPL